MTAGMLTAPSVRRGAPLPLRVACDPFESVRALIEGEITAPGLELSFETALTSPERHRRMVRDLAFDVCELNVSTFLIARDQGVPLTAIPVFLFRKFRHGNVFVRADSGIEAPADLAGCRVGVPNMQPAANVWIKGILRDDFGLDHRGLVHVAEEDEEIAFDPPADIKVERAPAGRSVFDMLVGGDLPAVISPLVPREILDGDPRVRRLFPDYLTRERSYFERTGLFPIMHVTAVRSDLLAEHSWLAATLVDAFEAAKRAAYRRLANTRIVPLAWFGAHWEVERRLFGGDAWPYGLTAVNRRNLQTAMDYSFDQGLTRTQFRLDDLFADVEGAGETASDVATPLSGRKSR